MTWTIQLPEQVTCPRRDCHFRSRWSALQSGKTGKYISSELLVLWGNQSIWSIYTLGETCGFRNRLSCLDWQLQSVHFSSLLCESAALPGVTRRLAQDSGTIWLETASPGLHGQLIWSCLAILLLLRRGEMGECDSFLFYGPLTLQLGGFCPATNPFLALCSLSWHLPNCSYSPETVSSPWRNINVVQGGRVLFWCSAHSD